jgi:hypothetical protein
MSNKLSSVLCVGTTRSAPKIGWLTHLHDIPTAGFRFIFWNDWPQKSTENTKEKSGSEGLGSMGFGQSVFFERRGMASAAGITTPQKG